MSQLLLTKKLKSELFYLYITMFTLLLFQKLFYKPLHRLWPALFARMKKIQNTYYNHLSRRKENNYKRFVDKFILTCSAFRSSSSKVAFFSPSFISSRLGMTTDVGLFPLLSPGAGRRFPSRTAFSLNETRKPNSVEKRCKK
mgnify:CR=1 FL=1